MHYKTDTVQPSYPAGENAVEQIAVALIEAHRLTEGDADPLTRHLIEVTLMHVGQRLAQAIAQDAPGQREGLDH